VRVYEISQAATAVPPMKFPITCAAGSDIKVRVDSVSDNDTIVTAELDMLIIDV
jgi:hypothetical protein